MPEKPLVSIICLCHNQVAHVAEAIQSVFNQDYEHIELIVVDDASTDSSARIIKNQSKRQSFNFLESEKNMGICKAFNMGLKYAQGHYIIDLAADDQLLPTRVSEGINAFQSKDIGVNFCDAYITTKDRGIIKTHYLRDTNGKLIERVPDGDVYLDLIRKYFISPPTMMVRRDVLETLNGYDEALTYEDFDFWIRSSRTFNYGFTDKILVKKKVLADSLSKNQFRFRSIHQQTTLKVCQKIKCLNQISDEDKALSTRCWYEIRQCIRQANLELVPGFLKLICS